MNKIVEPNLVDKDGIIIKRHWNISELKHHFRTDNINGKFFFLSNEEPPITTSSISVYYDECGLIDTIRKNYQLQHLDYNFVLNFSFKDSKTILTIDFDFNFKDSDELDHMPLIIERLLVQINLVFKMKLPKKMTKGDIAKLHLAYSK